MLELITAVLACKYLSLPANMQLTFLVEAHHYKKSETAQIPNRTQILNSTKRTNILFFCGETCNNKLISTTEKHKCHLCLSSDWCNIADFFSAQRINDRAFADIGITNETDTDLLFISMQL